MKNETIEIETDKNPTHSIIWLHGLGADASDSLHIINHINSIGLKIRTICPNAPKIPITINNGLIMRGWYDIKSKNLDDEKIIDLIGIENSYNIINMLVQREINRGINSKNIILGGFSQGGAMSLYTSMKLDISIAAVICLSGYIPIKIINSSLSNKNIPFFIAHGLCDQVVPIDKFYSCISNLKNNGYNRLLIKEYDNGHSVCKNELADIKKFIYDLTK